MSYSTTLPVTGSAICGPNAVATTSKSATVTATLTWQGSGQPPQKVLVVENAAVSWNASLVMAQNSVTLGAPPVNPNGTMNGSGYTGLGNDVKTPVPNPATPSASGESIVGTRKQTGTVTITGSTSGYCTLPPVTLHAEATATTGNQTTGDAHVTVGGYSVSVIEGTAHASASYNMVPDTDSDWTPDTVVYYGDKPAGVFSGQSMGFPKIALDLTNGMTGYYTVSVEAQQFLKTTVADPGLCRLYGSQSVEGYVSNGSTGASSEIVGTNIIGEAPNDDGLTYSKEQSFTHANSNPAALGGRSSNAPSRDGRSSTG